MNYKVTRNGQQTGKWFDNAADAHKWIEAQLKIETSMGYPRHGDYKAYYNLTGNEVNAKGEAV